MYVCMYVQYICVCVCMYVCIYICMYINIYIYIYMYIYSICMCINIYVCVCVCVYIYMCIYTVVQILILPSLECQWVCNVCVCMSPCFLKKRSLLWSLARALSLLRPRPRRQGPGPRAWALRSWSTAPRTIAQLKVPQRRSPSCLH